jgi:uncharacterized protein (DUF302 family)
MYAMVTTLEGVSYGDARERVIAALADEGFGVLTEIDVKATLAKKLEVDFRPYAILGACNPPLAHRALLAEPQLGIMLPCNVVVQQGEAGAVVSAINPRAMFGMIENAELETVMTEVDQRLHRVLDAVRGA